MYFLLFFLTELQYVSRLIPPYSVWTVDDVDLILFAMYRVLLQSRPDAPNDMVIQIPLTCSTLLPSLLHNFVVLSVFFDADSEFASRRKRR